MEVGKVMGGIAAAVAVEVIIDGIEGAIQREKLQSAIHDLLPPRIRLKRHAMINAREHVEQTTDATSVAMLAQLDASRHSWTNEDA